MTSNFQKKSVFEFQFIVLRISVISFGLVMVGNWNWPFARGDAMRNAVGVWGPIVVIVGTAVTDDHVGIVWTVAWTDCTDWTDCGVWFTSCELEIIPSWPPKGVCRVLLGYPGCTNDCCWWFCLHIGLFMISSWALSFIISSFNFVFSVVSLWRSDSRPFISPWRLRTFSFASLAHLSLNNSHDSGWYLFERLLRTEIVLLRSLQVKSPVPNVILHVSYAVYL